MKKLNKLFAILIAVLGVQTLSAQTDVTSTYLTNANFSSTSGWTQYVSSTYKDIGSGNIGGKLGNYAASSTDDTHLSSEYFFGFQCRWSGNYSSYNQETSQALPSGVYTLSYDVENVNGSTSAVNYNNLFYVKVGDKTFTDTSVEWMKGKSSWTSHSITFVITEATKATISLGYGTGSNNLISGSTPVLYVSHLKLTHRNIDDISAEVPADLTSYIVNNSFENGNLDGWTVGGYSSDTGVKPNSNGTYATSGVDGNYLYNTWWQGTPLTQTVANIPNGVYVLNVLLASDSGANLFLTANGEHGNVYTINTDNKTFHDVSFEFKVLNGQATIGVVGGNDAKEYVAAGHWWYKADNFRLTYKGADVSLLQEAFYANYTNLENLSTDDVPTAFAQKINDLISTYETAPTSKKALTTANTTIESVVNARPNIVTAYGSLKNLISTCNSLKTISEEQADGALETFSTAISTAITDADAATTVTELNNAYNTLESARRTYMQNAYPTSGNTLDFSYLIANGDWENNSGSNKVVNDVAHEERYAENPWKGDVMWDEVSGLANGMYNVEVYLSASAAEWNHTSKITDGDKNTSITVNDVKTLVEVYKRKSLSDAAVITLQDVMVKDGTMNFMIANEEEGANWIMVAHKSITMTGKIDNTALQNRITTLLTEANGIKSSDMNSTIKETLTTAINDADATSEDPDALNQMIESLEAAIAAANPSIADYAKLKRYIAMTEVFTDVTAYETKYNSGAYSSGDVDPVRKELNIARYNAASEVFPNEYKVTGWTGDLANNMLSSQHWSGGQIKYYDANSWGVNATGLKHTLSTTVTLPEGTYVLKAAGRSDSDVTLTLNIKDGDNVLESVEYTGKGDTGYGIDTEGHANFSEEATYANEDKGRGWEWEFAKFELDAKTTVTLHVEVDYNNIQNRFGSFSDITLWMDDDTYVTVYGKELDAPLAEAKTLVNTLPMGDKENTALQDAIATGEGYISGPSGLNEAVKALQDAVAKAKAWVPKYNEAKVELVKAFERFETDYNDGANGALRKMADADWDKLLEAVIAAAEAKDVTNSYADFEQAAIDFNAAMDAAEFAIANYLIDTNNGDVTSLIKNADFTGDVNSHSVGPSGGQVKSPAEWEFKYKFEGWHDAVIHDVSGTKVYNVWCGEMDRTGAYAELTQTVKYLPNGTYKLSAEMVTMANTDGSSWVAIYAAPLNEDESLSYSNIARSRNVIQGEDEDVYTNYEVYFKVEHNAAVVGVRTDKRYFKIKNIKLEKVEDNPAMVDNGILLQNAWAQRDASSWDITNIAIKASGAEIYLNNPNAVIYANEGQVNWANTAVDGTAESFTLVENNTFNATADFTATTLKYGREFSDNWLTVCLPFDYVIPQGVTVEKLIGIDTDEKAFTFEAITNVMEANTPYIIKNGTKNENLFASLSNAEVKATPEAMKVTVDDVDAEFVGTYTTKTSTELMEITEDVAKYDILFFGTDGQLYYLSQGVTDKEITFKPFRAYIRVAKGEIDWNDAQQARVYHRSPETTDIDSVDSADNGGQATIIYDLMGRKIETMIKGNIYIVNGKKIIL